MSEHGHERSDMNPKYVLYFAVGIVVVGAAIYLGVLWMFRQFEREQTGRQMPQAMASTAEKIPEPHLQISPQGDLEELRKQESEILSTYQWIDRDQGVARIPIDRAMQLFVERQKK